MDVRAIGACHTLGAEADSPISDEEYPTRAQQEWFFRELVQAGWDLNDAAAAVNDWVAKERNRW